MEPHIIHLCSWSLYLYLNLKSFIVIITYYYHCWLHLYETVLYKQTIGYSMNL